MLQSGGKCDPIAFDRARDSTLRRHPGFDSSPRTGNIGSVSKPCRNRSVIIINASVIIISFWFRRTGFNQLQLVSRVGILTEPGCNANRGCMWNGDRKTMAIAIGPEELDPDPVDNNSWNAASRNRWTGNWWRASEQTKNRRNSDSQREGIQLSSPAIVLSMEQHRIAPRMSHWMPSFYFRGVTDSTAVSKDARNWIGVRLLVKLSNKTMPRTKHARSNGPLTTNWPSWRVSRALIKHPPLKYKSQAWNESHLLLRSQPGERQTKEGHIFSLIGWFQMIS